MGEISRKEVCKCVNCGNEAEMMLTCSLEDVEAAKAAPAGAQEKAEKKVKAHGTCSHCGNEADMWIDM
jgi:Fe2+ or Zn2+ uptake regulation protein